MKCGSLGGMLEPPRYRFALKDLEIPPSYSLKVCLCFSAGNAAKIELENSVMSKVEQVLAAVDRSAELEIIRYAA